MNRREDEKGKNKNRIILILLLLIIFLSVYIYLGGMWTGEENEMPVEVEEIEQVEDVQDVQGEIEEEPSGETYAEEKVEEKTETPTEEVMQESPVIESTEEVAEEIEETEEEEEVEEEVEEKPVSDVKFGLAFSQRNDIWWKYQKRQKEIHEEAKKINDDRFSQGYLTYVDGNLKKLRYELTTSYKIDAGQLDYILEEGKNGKFNKAVESF